jgi:predicted dienelactone hydrolase
MITSNSATTKGRGIEGIGRPRDYDRDRDRDRGRPRSGSRSPLGAMWALLERLRIRRLPRMSLRLLIGLAQAALPLAATLAMLSGSPAAAAGLATISVPADGAAPALTGAVWTPCAAPPEETHVGPMAMQATRECPIVGTRLPLVVISHGVGGWSFGHHDLAEALADAGFVVAAIDHPVDGGRSADRSHSGEMVALTSRPADIHRLIDFMLAGWPGHARIDPARIGFFGFSRGGFTGLVLIGGTPDLGKLLPLCDRFPDLRLCGQLRAGEQPAPFTHDARIRAAVIADPAGGLAFLPDGLPSVGIPVQVWQSEFGGDGARPSEVADVARALPQAPDLHVANGAAHFAFLAPCGAAMAKVAAEICADAPGFDRVAFHAAMDRDVMAFFQSHLPATP